MLRQRGCACADLAVDKADARPRGLYERLGYRVVDLPPEAVVSLAPPDSPPPAAGSQWHFVGLNARHIAWDYYDRPADDGMRRHWARHREALHQRTGAPPGREGRGP